MKALAYQSMAQKRRNASALASCVATLHATLTAIATLLGMAGMSVTRKESHPVLGTGIFGSIGYNRNTGITSSGGQPQVAGG